MARKLILGTYDTIDQGPWALSSLQLTDPEYQQNFVTVPGRSGPLDLSTVLTDGEPIYGARTLTATLENSEGTREDREQLISIMTNWLSGWRMNIVHPDFPNYYLTGRVHIEKLYSDLAHAAVAVTAICDPWKYAENETLVVLTASAEEKTALLPNEGRMTVVPLLTIEGEDASVLLAFGAASWALGPGTYQLPDLRLQQGGAIMTYSGTGTIKLTYREAVL